jgi:hypothetical protein
VIYALKPAHKCGVRVALYGDITNQFSDEVLAIKSAFASAFVDSDAADFRLYVLTRDDFTLSPVFGSGKFQNADFVAFFPFAICFLANIANFSRDYVCTLEQTSRVCRARSAIGR